MTDERRDEFDDVLASVRGSLDLEIAQERRVITPDFAAVVEAARGRNPELVSEAAVRETGEFAPIVELGVEFERRNEAGSRDGLTDAQLDAWIADARALAEADVAARRLEGVPPLPEREAPEPRRWWASALAVAAVLVGLAVAAPRLLDAFIDGNYQEAESRANQAEYLGPEAEPDDGMRVRLQPEPSLVEPVSQQAIHRSDPPAQPEPRARAPRKRSPSADDNAAERAQARDRIAQLDAEAQARWAEGDLTGAERRFREIIEVADRGHRRYADLAYGDLFTLARQRNDEAAERALWREYLGRFPSGRYADDARAGLCRRAADDEREACWRAYLDDFPRGVHSRTAERALGLDEPVGSP